MVGDFDVEYRNLSRTHKQVKGKVTIRHIGDNKVQITDRPYPHAKASVIEIPKEAYEEIIRMEKEWGGK